MENGHKKLYIVELSPSGKITTINMSRFTNQKTWKFRFDNRTKLEQIEFNERFTWKDSKKLKIKD